MRGGAAERKLIAVPIAADSTPQQVKSSISTPTPDVFAPRVVSLLPAATEIVCALGAGDHLVGISHECDFPASAMDRPRVTWTPVRIDDTSAVIDDHVRRLHGDGQPVIAIDAVAFQAVQPDLVLAQDLCEVCAVVDGDVRALAAAFPKPPSVLGLAARSLSGIFGDIRRIGAALRREDEAAGLVRQMRERLDQLRAGHGCHDGNARGISPATPTSSGDAVRVVVIEWLEPLYLAGHWMPEVIACAGGRDVGAAAGAHSVRSRWSDLAALRPDITLVALCGFGLDRAVAEWQRFVEGDTADADWARALEGAIWALDGNAYTSRPGPRVVDGAEMIGHALCGEAVPGLVRLQ
jgi:iron complex transport system substrate-binding protein